MGGVRGGVNLSPGDGLGGFDRLEMAKCHEDDILLGPKSENVGLLSVLLFLFEGSKEPVALYSNGPCGRQISV